MSTLEHCECGATITHEGGEINGVRMCETCAEQYDEDAQVGRLVREITERLRRLPNGSLGIIPGSWKDDSVCSIVGYTIYSVRPRFARDTLLTALTDAHKTLMAVPVLEPPNPLEVRK